MMLPPNEREARSVHPDVPYLANERVYLRRLAAADIGDIREISFYDGRAADSDEEALTMLRRIDADIEGGTSLHWGVFPQDTSTCAGTCGFYRGFTNGTGEIGYVLREPFRGRGIMTDAVRLVIAHGFERLGLTWIEARVAPDNAASIRLLERVAFRLEKEDGEHLRYVRAAVSPT